MTGPQRFLLLLTLLGALSGAVRLLPRRIAGIPYQVVLAAAGLILGSLPGLALPKAGPDLILLAFVPGLVFEAALMVDARRLREVVLPVGVLATAGVLATFLLSAAIFHVPLGLAWPGALLLAAVLAPTDPIAVAGLVRRLGAPPRLVALLEGESLFNDGTGVAVFSAVVLTLAGGHPTLADGVWRLVLITAGGVAIGAAIGAAGLLALRLAREAEVKILLTLVVAYGAYLAGDALHVSGIVAVIVAGLLVSGWATRIPRVERDEVVDFWSVLAFILNAVLFVLIGESLPTRSLLPLLPLVVAAFAATILVRALVVYGLLVIGDPRRRLTGWRERHAVFWGGLRGALSIALALSLAGAPGVDQRVPVIAYGVVLLSLLLQGGTVGSVMGRLAAKGWRGTGASPSSLTGP